jgi:hypothetical protein
MSESLPVSLALVEAIAGRDRAAAVARELGVGSWAPDQLSAPLRISPGGARMYLANHAAFCRHEEAAIRVQDGVDDMLLALAADAKPPTSCTG